MYNAKLLRISAALLSLVALLGAPLSSYAGPIATSTVKVDVKVGEALMSDSSDAAELAMLRYFSGDNTLLLSGKTDANATSASPVPNMPGAWYLTDLTQPGYFALKFGTGGTLATSTTFFFRNTGDLNSLVWTDDQVQFLTGGACADNPEKCNIGRLSHYTTTVGVRDNVSAPGSVPEPGSFALLGLGLVAAGAAAQRRKNGL